mgnify:CR=1 FL=1|jgi:hypothetical protein
MTPTTPMEWLKQNSHRNPTIKIYVGHMAAPSRLKVIGWSDTWLHVKHRNGSESYYSWANIIGFHCDDDEQ